MKTRYTAQEMCEMALVEESYGWDVVAKMLRQAADEQKRLDSILDAIEKEFKKQSTCRSCEWRGKSIRSEPACPCDEDENFSVYEIDIIDRLRQAADMMDSKKKYEYAVEFSELCGKWEVYKNGLTEDEARKLSSEKWARPHRIVRREVGEWQTVC